MSKRVTHVVPIEAVRQGVTADGAIALGRLAAEHAEFRPDAIVELHTGGWVATLIYSKPGYPGRIHHAHIGLIWAPKESAEAA